MDTLAINTTSYPTTSTTVSIVAALVRALAGNTQGSESQTAPQPANPEAALARLGSILNLLLNPKNGAAPMDINLDQLVNNSALQNLLKQLPAELLSKPQVFQALVLQNTLLPSASGNEKTPILLVPQTASPTTPTAAPTQYRITLEWQNRLVQLLSPQPFPRGTQLQLQTTPRGEVVLLATQAPANSRTQSPAPEIGAKAAVALQPQALLQTAPDKVLTQTPQTPPALQTLQQSARELLPRQQALHTLVPLLQKFLQPSAQAQLPQPVMKAIAQLLQSLPRPEHVQNPATLRQAVENSGSFMESRLARAAAIAQPGASQLLTAANAPAAAATPRDAQAASQVTPEVLAKIIAGDTKAQLGAVLEVIRKFLPDTPTMARTAPPLASDELVYTHKPGAAPNTARNSAAEAQADSVDSLLNQLGKLLQAGVARIQLNQLDSASARQVGNDAQTPIPTWIVEIPLRTAYGADQLQLRIEQRNRQQTNRTRVQWNVDIALDLHAAGKLTAALSIVDKSVAATLWAEREQTHRAVRDEMDILRAGLESVGVVVTQMQCRLGVPPARASALTQRLVDVHT